MRPIKGYLSALNLEPSLILSKKSLATSIVSATAISGDTHPVIQATEE